MRADQFLLVAGLATLASARIEVRDAADCTDAASELLSDYDSVPTIAASLSSWVDAHITATYTDSCVVPAVTGSLADEYTSFMSEYSSWYMDLAKDYSSVLKACSDVPGITSEYASLTSSICTKVSWEDATGNSESGNAAPRETGMAMAAAAVAGFVVAGVV